MAGNVSWDLIANDQTGRALDSAVRNFRQANTRIKGYNDLLTKDISSSWGKSLLTSIDKFSPQLAQKLTGAVEAASDAAGPALGIGIAAALPFIGASISGAIIGAAGVGGIAGGLYAASKDARVQAEAQELAFVVQSKLSDAGGAFVQPAIKGLQIIEDAFDSIDLKGAFAATSKYVVPLAQGVATAVHSIGDALVDLAEHSGPVLSVIGQDIGVLGKTIGNGLQSLADDGPAAAEAINMLLGVINASLASGFAFVNILSEIYKFQSLLAHVTGFDKLPGWLTGMQGVGDAAKNATPSLDKVIPPIQGVGTSATDSSASLETFADKINDVATVGKSLFDTQTQVGDAISAATKAAKENGKTLDANTTSGRANRGALSDLAGALEANYQAYVKANGAGTDADQVAADNRASFIKLAESMGDSKTQANALADQLGLIPENTPAKITSNATTVEGQIKALQSEIDALKGKTITITVRQMTAAGEHISGAGGSGTQVKNSGGETWQAGDGNASRLGGPTPVNVASTVNVSLDGAPFRNMVATVVSGALSNAAHRAKVGRR